MKNHKGFTLIEIGIVLFVVGILVAILIPSFTQGIRDTAMAKRVISNYVKIESFVSILSKECNVPQSTVVNVLGRSGMYVGGAIAGSFDKILTGMPSDFNPIYQACYVSSNLAPIPALIMPSNMILSKKTDTANRFYIDFSVRYVDDRCNIPNILLKQFSVTDMSAYLTEATDSYYSSLEFKKPIGFITYKDISAKSCGVMVFQNA